MPLTLEEARVGIADRVCQEVIDEFRRSSVLLDRLIFDDAVALGTGGSTMTYGYVQLQTPSTASFRELNTEYTSNEAKKAKKAKKTVDLKIFGGSAQVDRVLQAASAEGEIEFQLKQKTIAARNLFHYAVINGGISNDVKEFDGLSKLLKNKSTEYSTTNVDLSTTAAIDSNYKYVLDSLDEFLSGLDGKPDLLLGNSKLIAKLKSVARRAGYLTRSEDSFGRSVSGYDGIPFLDLGNYYNGTKTVPAVTIDDTDGTTDLYAVKLGLDGFHGVSLSGGDIIKTYLPDLTQPGAVKKVEVEMIAAVALKNTLKAGVMRGIKIQPAKTQSGSQSGEQSGG